jgi:hypothetical protein
MEDEMDRTCKTYEEEEEPELLSFRTLSIVWYSKNQKIRRFGNWNCYRPQAREETPTLLGPLVRAILNH